MASRPCSTSRCPVGSPPGRRMSSTATPITWDGRTGAVSGRRTSSGRETPLPTAWAASACPPGSVCGLRRDPLLRAPQAHDLHRREGRAAHPRPPGRGGLRAGWRRHTHRLFRGVLDGLAKRVEVQAKRGPPAARSDPAIQRCGVEQIASESRNGSSVESWAGLPTPIRHGGRGWRAAGAARGLRLMARGNGAPGAMTDRSQPDLPRTSTLATSSRFGNPALARAAPRPRASGARSSSREVRVSRGRSRRSVFPAPTRVEAAGSPGTRTSRTRRGTPRGTRTRG